MAYQMAQTPMTLNHPEGQHFAWPTDAQNLKSLASAIPEIFQGVRSLRSDCVSSGWYGNIA